MESFGSPVPVESESVCVCAQLHPTLCDCMDCSRQASLSVGFSWQEHWSGLPFPTSGYLPDPGIKPASPAFPALASRFFTSLPRGIATLSQNLHVNKGPSDVMCSQVWEALASSHPPPLTPSSISLQGFTKQASCCTFLEPPSPAPFHPCACGKQVWAGGTNLSSPHIRFPGCGSGNPTYKDKLTREIKFINMHVHGSTQLEVTQRGGKTLGLCIILTKEWYILEKR